MTAGGKFLGTRPDKALEAWNALPEADRRPGAVQLGERGPIDPKKVQPTPPPGALILKVHYRCLGRDSNGKVRLARQDDFPHGGGRVNLDSQPNYLWLTESEWKSLIPSNPQSGGKASVPAAIAQRIIAGYLHPVLFHCACSPWSSDAIRRAELNLIVEQATPEGVRLRLEGFAQLGAAFDASKANDLKGPFGFEPRLMGTLEYDAKKKVITSFEFVALGDSFGYPNTDDASWRPAWRPGRQPLGVAFERVSGQSPLDRMPARILPPDLEIR